MHPFVGIAVQMCQLMLLFVLLLSLGCDQDGPFPALIVPDETADSSTLPVSQSEGQGTSDGEPSATPNPTALPVSQTSGQRAGIDEFTTDGGVPLASLSNKVQQVVPAVVRVNTDTRSGSGVIAQTQGNIGYVVTNHHVVQGANWIQVTEGDNTAYQAQVLGEDAVRDLAVLKICCGSFQPAHFGDVGGLEPGMEVMVIGYPRDLPGSATITRGIVSAIRFNTALQTQVIQTDAATNPGNSGGPIVSLSGEVLGVITLKYMDAEGLGFAVPGDVVLRQLPALWASEQSPPPVPSLVPVTTSDPDDDELTRRIEEAIQELVPTPMPALSPAPKPTPAPRPTPAPVATPTSPPPTIAPTPHPCELARIPPLDELELEYGWFMLGDPYTNSVSTDFREVLARLFPEITAAYILEFIDDPLRYASFHDYLQKVGYQGANRGIRADFQRLRRSGVLPRVDESSVEYLHYLQESGVCNWARMTVFADDQLMWLLAVVYAQSGVSPSMGDAVARITSQDIQKFRDRDPTTPLIYFILEMDDAAN